MSQIWYYRRPGRGRAVLVEIVVNPIIPADRDRWAELWRGYLDFYETRLPPEIYDDTWQRLIAAEGTIHGLGSAVRLGRSSGSPTTSFTRMPGRRRRSVTCRISSSTQPADAVASAAGSSKRSPGPPASAAATGSTGPRRKTTPRRGRSTTGLLVSTALFVTITRSSSVGGDAGVSRTICLIQHPPSGLALFELQQKLADLYVSMIERGERSRVRQRRCKDLRHLARSKRAR